MSTSIAGKVAITPKGEYDVDTTYTKLDLVRYANDGDIGVFLAKKTSVGQEPVMDSDTDYWQFLLKNQAIDVATLTTIGIVKPDGTTITIDADGTIHGTSELEPATTTTLGGIIVGDNLSIDSDGKLSADDGGSAEDISYDNTTSGLEADNVQDALTEINKDLQKIFVRDSITIPTSGWEEDEDYLKLDIEDENVTEDTVVNINLDLESLEIAENAGLKSLVVSSSGVFSLYADDVPENDMTGTITYQKGVS